MPSSYNMFRGQVADSAPVRFSFMIDSNHLIASRPANPNWNQVIGKTSAESQSQFRTTPIDSTKNWVRSFIFAPRQEPIAPAPEIGFVLQFLRGPSLRSRPALRGIGFVLQAKSSKPFVSNNKLGSFRHIPEGVYAPVQYHSASGQAPDRPTPSRSSFRQVPATAQTHASRGIGFVSQSPCAPAASLNPGPNPGLSANSTPPPASLVWKSLIG
jgi:hypothetical protein